MGVYQNCTQNGLALNQLSSAQNRMTREMYNQANHEQIKECISNEISNAQHQIEFERHMRALEEAVSSARKPTKTRPFKSVRPHDTRPARHRRGSPEFVEKISNEVSSISTSSKSAINTSTSFSEYKKNCLSQASSNKKSQVPCKRNYSEVSTDLDDSCANKNVKTPEDLSPKLMKSPTINKSRLDLGVALDPETYQLESKTRVKCMNFNTKNVTEGTALVVFTTPSILLS